MQPVIDFHTHVFPEKIAENTIRKLGSEAGVKAFTDGTLHGLKEAMKEGNVGLSVILPVITRIDQFDSIFRFACKINETEEEIISFGAVFPGDPDYKNRLRILKKYGMKGIKLHPDYHGIFFDDPLMLSLLEEAFSLDFIVSVHGGIDIGLPEPVHCTPDMCEKVLDKLKPKKLILAHTGGWKMWDEVEEKLVGREVYFDTSFTDGYIDPEQWTRIIKGHGTKRIVFGTDSPWSGQARTIDAVCALPLTESEKEDILFRTGLELLGLNKQKEGLARGVK